MSLPPQNQHRKPGPTLIRIILLAMLLLLTNVPSLSHSQQNQIQYLDLNHQSERQVIVDREPGQYLGHPTTVLLEDGKTMLCVYPKGHGRGAIVYKRSHDAGKTWSPRLPTPKSWNTSKEVPTLHRVTGPDGQKRIILFSGLYPARMAATEDDGKTWSELKKIGDWGGIVVMGCVFPQNTGAGHYMAMFHDDGRFISSKNQQQKPRVFNLFKTTSVDGGLAWSDPVTVHASSKKHICEPGVIRSPDGKTLAVLLRENSRRHHSQVIFSNDEGNSWSEPQALPLALTGDRHTAQYAPDGRLFISFRRRMPNGKDDQFINDWVGWVGTFEDIVDGRSGQYLVRLKKNFKGADCAYPGVEVLPDGTFVTTTYGHWQAGQQPYIMSVRVKLNELDQMSGSIQRQVTIQKKNK